MAKKQNTKTNRHKSNPKKILIGILAVCVIIFVFFNNRSTVDVSEGRNYVRQQQDASIKNVKAAVTKKRSEEREKAIKDDKLNIYSMFDDYVFLGDSRVMGFKTYGLLEKNRILSDSGGTIKNVDDHLQQIRELNPSTVYISYGVNDMGSNLNSSKGGYRGLYQREVKKIATIVPEAKIVVCSIIPCTPETLEKSPNWADYKKYNQELEKMCVKNGWTYVDCTSLADGGNADIYQSDGIHFLVDFYPKWANAIIDGSSNE